MVASLISFFVGLFISASWANDDEAVIKKFLRLQKNNKVEAHHIEEVKKSAQRIINEAKTFQPNTGLFKARQFELIGTLGESVNFLVEDLKFAISEYDPKESSYVKHQIFCQGYKALASIAPNQKDTHDFLLERLLDQLQDQQSPSAYCAFQALTILPTQKRSELEKQISQVFIRIAENDKFFFWQIHDFKKYSQFFNPEIFTSYHFAQFLDRKKKNYIEDEQIAFIAQYHSPLNESQIKTLKKVILEQIESNNSKDGQALSRALDQLGGIDQELLLGLLRHENHGTREQALISIIKDSISINEQWLEQLRPLIDPTFGNASTLYKVLVSRLDPAQRKYILTHPKHPDYLKNYLKDILENNDIDQALKGNFLFSKDQQTYFKIINQNSLKATGMRFDEHNDTKISFKTKIYQRFLDGTEKLMSEEKIPLRKLFGELHLYLLNSRAGETFTVLTSNGQKRIDFEVVRICRQKRITLVNSGIFRLAFDTRCHNDG